MSFSTQKYFLQLKIQSLLKKFQTAELTNRSELKKYANCCDTTTFSWGKRESNFYFTDILNSSIGSDVLMYEYILKLLDYRKENENAFPLASNGILERASVENVLSVVEEKLTASIENLLSENKVLAAKVRVLEKQIEVLTLVRRSRVSVKTSMSEIYFRSLRRKSAIDFNQQYTNENLPRSSFVDADTQYSDEYLTEYDSTRGKVVKKCDFGQQCIMENNDKKICVDVGTHAENLEENQPIPVAITNEMIDNSTDTFDLIEAVKLEDFGQQYNCEPKMNRDMETQYSSHEIKMLAEQRDFGQQHMVDNRDNETQYSFSDELTTKYDESGGTLGHSDQYDLHQNTVESEQKLCEDIGIQSSFIKYEDFSQQHMPSSSENILLKNSSAQCSFDDGRYIGNPYRYNSDGIKIPPIEHEDFSQQYIVDKIDNETQLPFSDEEMSRYNKIPAINITEQKSYEDIGIQSLPIENEDFSQQYTSKSGENNLMEKENTHSSFSNGSARETNIPIEHEDFSQQYVVDKNDIDTQTQYSVSNKHTSTHDRSINTLDSPVPVVIVEDLGQRNEPRLFINNSTQYTSTASNGNLPSADDPKLLQNEGTQCSFPVEAPIGHKEQDLITKNATNICVDIDIKYPEDTIKRSETNKHKYVDVDQEFVFETNQMDECIHVLNSIFIDTNASSGDSDQHEQKTSSIDFDVELTKLQVRKVLLQDLLLFLW